MAALKGVIFSLFGGRELLEGFGRSKYESKIMLQLVVIVAMP